MLTCGYHVGPDRAIQQTSVHLFGWVVMLSMVAGCKLAVCSTAPSSSLFSSVCVILVPTSSWWMLAHVEAVCALTPRFVSSICLTIVLYAVDLDANVYILPSC